MAVTQHVTETDVEKNCGTIFVLLGPNEESTMLVYPDTKINRQD